MPFSTGISRAQALPKDYYNYLNSISFFIFTLFTFFIAGNQISFRGAASNSFNDTVLVECALKYLKPKKLFEQQHVSHVKKFYDQLNQPRFYDILTSYASHKPS